MNEKLATISNRSASIPSTAQNISRKKNSAVKNVVNIEAIAAATKYGASSSSSVWVPTVDVDMSSLPVSISRPTMKTHNKEIRNIKDELIDKGKGTFCVGHLSI